MFSVGRQETTDGTGATYRVTGEILFASVDRFTRAFQAEGPTRRVVIDVTRGHF